jgi:hypothetical protein
VVSDSVRIYQTITGCPDGMAHAQGMFLKNNFSMSEKRRNFVFLKEYNNNSKTIKNY